MSTPSSGFHVFKQVIYSNESTNASIQPFPWALGVEGVEDNLFRGRVSASERWLATRVEFSPAVAVVDSKSLYVLLLNGTPSYCFPLDTHLQADPQDRSQVAWALRSTQLSDPLVIVANNRRIFVFSVKHRKVCGYIRGHGGRITAIAVHPTLPNIFATTSADFTTRLYNLDLEIPLNEDNPIWPPWEGPALASAAHGTDGVDSAGTGIGRCFQILVGGRSGGHNWDVLGAAFHPRLPLIATCGVREPSQMFASHSVRYKADRHVKIWRINYTDKAVFREDKPLFSAKITTSRVLSIAWLGDDMLLIHTATTSTPATEDPSQTDSELTYEPSGMIIDPGTIDIIEWLGFKRFFPDDGRIPDQSLRGGASDYLDSKSYLVLATQKLTFSGNIPTNLITNISQPPLLPGYFLLVDPESMEVCLSHLSSVTGRAFPVNNDAGDSLVDMTKRIRLDDNPSPLQNEIGDGTLPAERLFQFEALESGERIAACALMATGEVVILGTRGRMWFFRDSSPQRLHVNPQFEENGW
ncbi:coatomer beta subunit [Favolaschia claudopus]|uniref:Coatomer beta subunit n=1 Tax=Favolaschia claudopus TaxID=2862362 RepID=A0AAV9ZHW7_9AGAR